jgi:hypothetical protein
MKNLTTVLFTIALFAWCSTSFASNSEKPLKDSTRSAVNTVVERIIAYPPNIRFAHEKEIVLISFSVEPCGSLQIHESNSSNPEFLRYVTKKIEENKMTFVRSGESTHYLKLTFVSH